jgi:hypothetical protein
VADVPEGEDLITDVEWVTVAQSTGFVLGRIIQTELEAQGIPATVSGAVFDTVKLYETPDMKIRVPKRFFDQAKQIVDDLSADAGQTLVCDSCGKEVGEMDTVCPHCGEDFVPDELKADEASEETEA